ncbi:MAG: 50S ribosomal protein L30 [Deltaproteobacteria bacterium]|jgi:large subunit ribosomal protein L30|nr:50S ribosomal protein L30 [Deltaproteobacteria bacterium]
MQKMMKIKLLRSPAGRIPKHCATIKGLGLTKTNSERTIVDNPQTRGMVKEIGYLVSVIEDGISGSKQAKG